MGGGGLIRPSPDPLSEKALRPHAPEELRKALEEAEGRYREAQGLCEQAFKRWRDAMNERSKFMRGVGLAEKSYQEAEELESQARIEVAQAQVKLQRWCWHERLRREAEAKRAREKEKGANPPLGERLKKFKQKVLG